MVKRGTQSPAAFTRALNELVFAPA